ncbi:MAG: 1-deoxy-D-xylulose-5-phosphate reductoisomerase [Ancrocorticia sp.]|uniref:1-deoxy-D-xylulose-5-phosphate reductoisomerase n=1 Tax=Ancrocorticia sp. TaxID=2593684 RepID=UPI003F920423
MTGLPATRGVVILGSTGSIGTQALDVIGRNRDRYTVLALGAGGGSVQLLARQAKEFSVPIVGIADPSGKEELEQLLTGSGIQIIAGPDAMADLAGGAGQDRSSDPGSTVVLNGITGSVGLRPTLAALSSGATLALANKESLVVGGGLISDAMVRPGQIVPVDSEHSAIVQSLRSGIHHRGLCSVEQDGASEVKRIILTASGGPFRGRNASQLTDVTPADALNHPTWAMGPVVTINSSTLMNKGLELIEAAYLFDIAPESIVPVVHPQSVIHSMVEFTDGATIAQASPPDMRLPIALGLSWPERLEAVSVPNAWDSPVAWNFEPLDHETFPAVSLARDAVAASPLHPAVLNAANEECVGSFLAGELPYLGITATVAEILSEFSAPRGTLDVETVLGTEKWARVRAHEVMAQRR